MTDKCKACDEYPREPASPYCARCEEDLRTELDDYEQFVIANRQPSEVQFNLKEPA
jgi:hypothetical protein